MSDQPEPAPAPAGEDPLLVRSEHSGAFLRLATLWRRRSHFSLVFATCDNPRYRDALIAHLLTEAPAVRLDLAEADLPRDWLAGAAAAAQQQPGRLHICLPLGQPRASDWWQQANLLRERLAEALPGVQVLWLTDADVQAAAHHAPDLWNWREAVLGFCAVPGEQMRQELPGPRFDAASGMAAEALRVRLADIDAVLARQGDLEPGVAHLLLEAAQAHERLGDWNRSLAAAERAVQAFEASDDARSVAQAELQRAIILWHQGQPALALQRLRQAVLPVFERLGDEGSKAVTMGRIADILEARGQLDEALRICQQEELPFYERLGDVREKAVTMGKIADILQARGQLYAALRIRQQEELPVYERLGDVREKAVTMGKIADILEARGQLDEALRICQQEELPIFERLGGVRDLLVSQTNIAFKLLQRGLDADRAEADVLLQRAHAAARQLQLPEAAQIAQIYQQAFGRPMQPLPPSAAG